jgi:hypothetical protein
MSNERYLEDILFDDLTPKVKRIPNLNGKEYVLLEPTEGDAVAYRNAVMKSVRMADGKMIGLVDAAEVEPLLVSKCIREVVPNPKTGVEERRPVQIQVVRGWPSKVVKRLFNDAKEMGELDEKDSKERTALIAALSRPETPITVEDFREYVRNLAENEDATPEERKKYAPLYTLVKLDEKEESLKNGSVATAKPSE